VAGTLLVVVSLAVFWRTAYPTITWWDSSEYSLAAATLGLVSAPGSLLLTLIGWPVAHLPFGSSPAYLLNLFAGVLAAAAVLLVYFVAMRLLRLARPTDIDARRRALMIGAALGALTFAFSDTLWEHATKFSPYILTPVFTGLILWTLARWWEDAESTDGWKWLALFGLLIGLDFSVHRTNALIIPGAMVWILVRNARALLDSRAVVGSIAGLIAGLALQLLVIPIAAFGHSPVTFWDPSNWSRFWDYVSLQSRGGGFLVDLFPRKSTVWSVQIPDFLHTLRADFLGWNGSAHLLGLLPAVVAIVGLVVLWRANRRLAIAYAAVAVLQATITVLYFNIPGNYFRTFDRHYLPVCVTIGVLVAIGVASAMSWAIDLHGRKRAVTGLVVAAGIFAPVAQLAGNWHARDASKRYFARDFAANMLGGLAPNAILFTVGDNDTFPLMYLHDVEGVRPDVTIINESVANIAGYAERLKRREPSVPISMTPAERRAMAARPKTDTLIVVPIATPREQLGLPAGSRVPDSIAFVVRPGTTLWSYPFNITLVDIVRTNQWRRPLTFAITGSNSGMAWLLPYGRLDGLFYRIVPARNPAVDRATFRANLDRVELRGYADSAVIVEDVSRTMGYAYYGALSELLAADRARGDMDACQADRKAMLSRLPPERLRLVTEMEALALVCDGRN
jgi:hypothetical protein